MFSVEYRSGKTAKPVFMSVDLETPLGFTAFLANSSNHRKVFIPSTFNASKILKSIRAQASTNLICDSSFYELEVPEPKRDEYSEAVSSVENAIVAGSSNVRSSIFKASLTLIDPLTLA